MCLYISVLSSDNEDEFKQIINEYSFLKKATKEHNIKFFFVKNHRTLF